MSTDPSNPEQQPKDVDQRIAELEARIARRNVGVMPPIAAVIIFVCAWLMYEQRDDVAYFYSPVAPISLGAEGSYAFEKAISNRYAEVHGTPTVRGVYWQEKTNTYVAIGLNDTPLLVRRPTLPNESWKLGERAPPPDQRPFTVRGRLLSRADAAKYADAFEQHEKSGEVKPRWILLAEERPGSDLGGVVWFWGLGGFALLNAWLLVRGLVAVNNARRSSKSPTRPHVV